MVGHIAGLGLSQRMNANGHPLAGCKLYIYDGGTSTPASVFTDYAVSIAHTFPIVADSAGIIPMFWLADGTYRARLVDADGNEIFDEDGIVALGPSSGSGGGGSTTPAAAIFGTGDFLWLPISGTRTGWVRANARTIGSAASGATERSNADVEDLFLYLWNNYSNTLCPVTGGRGANAAADWSANKIIATLDMRDVSPFGLSDMGNTDTGLLGTSAASSGGAATVTISTSNLPSVNLSLGSLTGSVGTDISNGTAVVRSLVPTTASRGTGAQDCWTSATTFTSTTLALTSGTVTFGGSIPLGGGAAALNKMPPYRLGTWYVKL